MPRIAATLVNITSDSVDSNLSNSYSVGVGLGNYYEFNSTKEIFFILLKKPPQMLKWICKNFDTL